MDAIGDERTKTTRHLRHAAQPPAAEPAPWFGTKDATDRPIEEDLLRIPPGTRYRLPDTGTRLPYVHNPHAGELIDEVARDMRPLLERCLGTDLTAKILGEDDIHNWACYLYSFADRERMRLLINAALAFIAWDDPYTRTALAADPNRIQRRITNFAAALRGRRPPPDQPAELLVWQTLEDIATRSTPAFTARARQICLDVNASVITETRHRLTKRLPDWDDYVPFRRVNLYGYWVVVEAEFSVGVDMTVALAASPDLRALEQAAVDYVLFTNDLYSFPKEAKIGEVANTFWLLRRDGMSIQAAVDHLAALLIAKQDEFLAHREAILAGRFGKRADVRRYLDAVAHALGGNLHYHRTSGRYHGPDHDGAPVTNGTITIGERSNTFTPAPTP
jgi:hypothetical protein